MWLVSFLDVDLGYFESVLVLFELATNPFAESITYVSGIRCKPCYRNTHANVGSQHNVAMYIS